MLSSDKNLFLYILLLQNAAKELKDILRHVKKCELSVCTQNPKIYHIKFQKHRTKNVVDNVRQLSRQSINQSINVYLRAGFYNKKSRISGTVTLRYVRQCQIGESSAEP